MFARASRKRAYVVMPSELEPLTPHNSIVFHPKTLLAKWASSAVLMPVSAPSQLERQSMISRYGNEQELNCLTGQAFCWFMRGLSVCQSRTMYLVCIYKCRFYYNDCIPKCSKTHSVPKCGTKICLFSRNRCVVREQVYSQPI